MDKVTCERAVNSLSVNSKGAHIIHGNQHAQACHKTESTAWIFPLYFQLPYLLEETYFQQAGSSAVEVTSQTVLGFSDQRRVPASVSLFRKSEKIWALLYAGKGPEYRPFSYT
jgi:hypothetical protein